MKKIISLSILILTGIILLMGSNFAEAKTQEFYFPVINEPSNLFEKIISDFGLRDIFNFKAKAIQSTISQPNQTRIGSDGEDAEYSQGMIKVDDGGGGADDGHFYLDFPTDQAYVGTGGISYSEVDCSDSEFVGKCFQAEATKQTIHPWRVFEAKIFTQSATTDNCEMDVLITEPGVFCSTAGSSGKFYGANDGKCGLSGNTVTAYLDEGNFSNMPAGRACGHVRINGGGIFDLETWRGYLKATAKSPEFEDFKVKGKDSETGNNVTAWPGQTINICAGDFVDIQWGTSDVQNVWLVYGDVDTSSCGGCTPGEPTAVSFNGAKTVKPLSSTNFSLIVRGATGDGPLYLSPSPISVSLSDCEPPEIEHCDPINNNEIGENPFCLALYDLPEYGSKKKCCNWPDDIGEFGDGCGKCKSVPPPEGFPSVDLKVNGDDDLAEIDSGESVLLSWTSEDADTCSADIGWSGNKELNSSETISNITEGKVFKIICSNTAGSSFDEVEVRIKDDDGETPSPSPPTPTPQPKGNIRVRIRLDGELISGNNVSYSINGPQSLSGQGTKLFNNIKVGQYIITYNSGIPSVMGINKAMASTIQFKGYSPTNRAVLVKNNKTANFFLDFETVRTCDLEVKANLSNCDGTNTQEYTGPLSFALIGPVDINGTAVSQLFELIPEGEYYLYPLAGPGTLDSITPSNPILCIPEQQRTATMNFLDCGGDTGYRYSCNSASGKCEICLGSVEECPYSLLSQCQQECSGGDCQADSEIDCWTNYDSEQCIGLIDEDPSPNAVLSTNSAGCLNVSSCLWEVEGHPEYTKNDCSPLSFGDDPGTYTAKLTVVDTNNNIFTDTQDVVIQDISELTCNFVWSPKEIKVNTEITFFDRSLTPKDSEVNSWNWEFEGANISSSNIQNPVVVFSNPGSKSVSLEAENSIGQSCSLSLDIEVKSIRPSWEEVPPR